MTSPLDVMWGSSLQRLSSFCPYCGASVSSLNTGTQGLALSSASITFTEISAESRCVSSDIPYSECVRLKHSPIGVCRNHVKTCPLSALVHCSNFFIFRSFFPFSCNDWFLVRLSPTGSCLILSTQSPVAPCWVFVHHPLLIVIDPLLF